MSSPTDYLTSTVKQRRLFDAAPKGRREALKVDADEDSSCGSPAKKRATKLPLCGNTGRFCATLPSDCQMPRAPLSDSLLRITFTGERHLKWRVRRLRKDGTACKSKSAMDLVDCVTGRVFKMPPLKQ